MKHLIPLIALLSLACGEATETDTPDPVAPTEFSQVDLPASDKADGLSLVCGDIIHQPSQDITVISARVAGRATPSSNTVPSSVPVDVADCAVLEDTESQMSDCRFYDECREQTVDCRAELARTTDSTFLDTATFSRVTKVANADGAPRYYAENFNCHVVEIVTATRDEALPHAKAMGLWFDHSVTFVDPAQAKMIGQGKLHNGDRVTLHRFAGLSICWAGSFSASEGQTAEFKPFLVFADRDACYVDWDATPKNYAISLKSPEFDRWFDVLQ